MLMFPVISSSSPVSLGPERWAILALLPLAATIGFYLLPDSLQRQTSIQFLPQLTGYLGLSLWAWKNTHLTHRLGIQRASITPGIILGSLIGFLLGLMNTGIILWVIPTMGNDIQFLKETPHAQIPVMVMIPWFVVAIAVAVELNFRAFLLGRLITLFTPNQRQPEDRLGRSTRALTILATFVSALTFTFDPFMVNTFQYLHWIALWDGLIWGGMWLRYRNLYTVIAAHAVEVIILYSCMKLALS